MFTKENFTEDEFKLLKLAFELLDVTVEGIYKLNWDRYDDIVYSLKNKLGIYDLLD